MSVNDCDLNELYDLKIIDASFRKENIFPLIHLKLSETRVFRERDKRLWLERGKQHTMRVF